MLITPHILVGAAIGTAVGNPVAGFALGIASHFVLDNVPHTDPGTWHFYEPFSTHKIDARDFTCGILDAAAAFFGVLWLAGQVPILEAGSIAGMIGGALPDTLVLAGLFYPPITKWKFLDKYFDWTEKYHKTASPKQWVLGTVTQVAAIGLSVWYLFAS